MTLVVVDTSAWVDYFQGNEEAVRRVDPLLSTDDVGICDPILAELLSGAPSFAELKRLERLLAALGWIPLPDNAWRRAAEARFALARQGTQAAFIDLLIALAALEVGAVLLTRDRDFDRISQVLPVRLQRF